MQKLEQVCVFYVLLNLTGLKHALMSWSNY